MITKLSAILLLLAAGAAIASAQNTGLVIQVNPEAHLNISSVPLVFTVSNPGETVVSQPVTITAWVRNLPGETIQLTAQVGTLDGPAGSKPVSAVSWSGSLARATGGASVASCTLGSFAAGSVQSLISGWTQSGIASCTVTFRLETDASWTPGTYASNAGLKLFTR